MKNLLSAVVLVFGMAGCGAPEEGAEQSVGELQQAVTTVSGKCAINEGYETGKCLITSGPCKCSNYLVNQMGCVPLTPAKRYDMKTCYVDLPAMDGVSCSGTLPAGC